MSAPCSSSSSSSRPPPWRGRRLSSSRPRLPWGSITLGHDNSPSTSAPQLSADFSGTWIKDRAASDSMEAALDLLSLGGIMRTAIRLIKGIKITADAHTFTMAVFSVLSWFKVTERYAMDGKACRCRRRDFRRGGHEGRVQVAGPRRLVLHLAWQDPFGGRGTDEFELACQDQLHVTSTVTVGGRSVRYKQVYNRRR